MSKVNVQFDTETKDFSVDIDGSVLSNVNGFRLNTYDGKGEVSIEMSDPESNGMRQYHCIYASECIVTNRNTIQTDDKKFTLVEDRQELLARDFSELLLKN